MDKQDYEILVNTIPKNVRPPEFAVKLLEDTCRDKGLNWKARHCYLGERGGKWSVTVSIDGFRLIAASDPDYGGQEGPFWTMGPDKPWSDIPPEGIPYAAKVGVKHKSGNVTWGVAKFKDYKTGPMWDKLGATMVAKCAEMLALRKAMPGKLGGLYGIEEMGQADKNIAKLLEGEGGFTDPRVEQGVSQVLMTNLTARMEAAMSIDVLKAIGAEIQADNAIPLETKLRLHNTYQVMKEKLS